MSITYVIVCKYVYFGNLLLINISNIYNYILFQIFIFIIATIFAYLNYQYNAIQVTWTSLFDIMERAIGLALIDDYSISQTTLEQVFINLARSQLSPEEVRESRCDKCRRRCCRRGGRGLCCRGWCLPMFCCCRPLSSNDDDDEDDEEPLII